MPVQNAKKEAQSRQGSALSSPKRAPSPLLSDSKKGTGKPKTAPSKTIQQKKTTKPEVGFRKRVEKSTEKTTVIVKYNCGFPNDLYIRGEGISTLSWDKGQPLQNISEDEWLWETERPCTTIEFKILINDIQYEQGQNHSAHYGSTQTVTPCF